MGKTLSEKILAKASGNAQVSAGDIVWADVDIAMMDDVLGPRVEIAEKLGEFGEKIWDTSKVVVISDHFTPPATARQAEFVKFTRDWAESHGIASMYEYVGPCHQVLVDNGFIVPGTVVVGTDSHTCTGGALGAFSTGVGSTEMLGVLVSGKIWFKVPETIKVIWDNTLPEHVMAKDVSLKTIGRIRHAGATYKAVEYEGEAISAMPVDQRLAITNMAVEMGAKVGLIAPDEKTTAYLDSIGVHGYGMLRSDPDAVFCRVERFDAATLGPQVACPSEVDNVTDVEGLERTKIHQAFIGSCTGGRLSDLHAAAEVLKGRKVAKGVRLLVSPSSDKIWKAASADGTLLTLAEAGAVIMAPTCGPCASLHSGVLASGERCISATNRNFPSRMGAATSLVYLGSPKTVAASAVTGVITSPRNLA